MREFLVASSIVDRMTGELCNALLGISHSQSLLERLERSQLFIQPLDSHGHWYRYHTLFLDFLRSVLRRGRGTHPAIASSVRAAGSRSTSSTRKPCITLSWRTTRSGGSNWSRAASLRGCRKARSAT
jgi:ATP/maltotriose-dependent transcriptional regulator MalT